MSTLSDFTITFNKSTDLIRCGVLIHLLAAVMLWQSRVSLVWMSLLVVVLIISYWNTHRLAALQWISLSRHHSGWILQGNHHEFCFDSLQIAFNGGFFLLLRGKVREKPVKQIVIFLDQLSSDAYRLLMLSQRLSKSKKIA